jgi:hypothetical protein
MYLRLVKKIALLQAEASACGVGLANVLFARWVIILFHLSFDSMFISEL